MKKRKSIKILLIILCLCFFGIKNVHADTLGFTCNDEALEVGNTTTCKVVGTTNHPSRGVVARLGSNENLEISDIVNISPFTDGSTPIYYTKTAPAAAAGDYDIVSFTVTALSSGTGTLTLRDFSEDDGMGFIDGTGDQFYYLEAVNFDIPITNGGGSEPSNDSLLTSLVPNIGELEQTFTSDNTNYNMSLDFTRVRRVSFTITKSHPLATVSNTECTIPDSTTTENLVCNIKVTAEDRVTSTTYKITIANSAYTPPEPPSGDIFINRLTFDIDAVLSPRFDKNINNYEMSVNFSNVHEINFTVQVDDGVVVSGKKCILPSGFSSEQTTCVINISKDNSHNTYKITVKNTDRQDIQCDLIIRSNIYTIDQINKVIKVNSEQSLEVIKSNLYSTCGEIKVYNDKVTISDNANTVEYKLERIIMPKTGNNKIIYPLGIVSILFIIGIFVFAKKKLLSKEN